MRVECIEKIARNIKRKHRQKCGKEHWCAAPHDHTNMAQLRHEMVDMKLNGFIPLHLSPIIQHKHESINRHNCHHPPQHTMHKHIDEQKCHKAPYRLDRKRIANDVEPVVNLQHTIECIGYCLQRLEEYERDDDTRLHDIIVICRAKQHRTNHHHDRRHEFDGKVTAATKLFAHIRHLISTPTPQANRPKHYRER